jgi:hypothetical protein
MPFINSEPIPHVWAGDFMEGDTATPRDSWGKTLGSLLILGMWIGGILYVAIGERSVNAAISLGAMMAFAVVPLLCSYLKDSPRLSWIVLRRVLLIGWALTLSWVVLATIERLYFVNADTYPRWLAKPVTMNLEDPLHDFCKQNGQGYIRFIERKSNGTFLRCGELWEWGNTYWLDNGSAEGEGEQ